MHTVHDKLRNHVHRSLIMAREWHTVAVMRECGVEDGTTLLWVLSSAEYVT